MKNLNEARIYVGTYDKYNRGNLCGAWLDLSDYSNKGEFYEACKKLHKDENDPEFMFQDWENIPSELISESYIPEKLFELKDALSDLTDTEQEAFFTWINYTGNNLEKKDAYDLIKRFQDEYIGEYDDEEDFAYTMVEECYDLPNFAKTYFDYEKFAKDLFMCDYYFDNGFVFQR